MSNRVEKKVWPKYFEKILSGEKKFELRLADFDIEKDDILVLREWDPRPNVPFGTGGQKPKGYTGRSIEKRVTMVLRTKSPDFQPWSQEDIEKYGYQVIGIE